MKKGDTLRQLIREAVLAEMGEMWRHGRVGETRMGAVVDMGTVDTIYFEGTPEECQAWIEENTEGAPEIVRGKNVILFKVWGDPATGRRGAWPGLNEMAVLAEMSIYDKYDNLRSSLPTRITGDPRWSIIEDWIEAERGVNSTTAAVAMKAWFEEVMGQVVDDIWVDFGGWVTVFGPGFPWDNELKANALALTREELADMFYGRG